MGLPETVVFVSLLDVLLLLVSLRVTRWRHKNTAQHVYIIMLAWVRAGIYFSLCGMVSLLAGVPQHEYTDPWATTQQIQNPWWWAGTAAAYGLTLAVAVVVWGRRSLRFGRPVLKSIQAVVGLLWGYAIAHWYLTIFTACNAVWEALGPGTRALKSAAEGGGVSPLSAVGLEWGGVVLGTAVAGAWQALLDRWYWDVYVLPEHNTPESRRIKQWAFHVPLIFSVFAYCHVTSAYILSAGIVAVAYMAVAVQIRLPILGDGHYHRAGETAEHHVGRWIALYATGCTSSKADPFIVQKELEKDLAAARAHREARSKARADEKAAARRSDAKSKSRTEKTRHQPSEGRRTPRRPYVVRSANAGGQDHGLTRRERRAAALGADGKDTQAT